MYAVTFHPNGKHVLGGNEDGIRRWQLADGQEVGKQAGMELQAIAVSRDDKWVVCGTRKGASVWDGEMCKKAIDVESENDVWAVGISPDSTRFVTATDKAMSIWSLTSGERLVGPLEHDDHVSDVRFSPNGEHIAIACLDNSIRIIDSHTGVSLIAINTDVPQWGPATPLAWSSDGQEIFTASHDNKIRSFDTSTGSPLAESQPLHNISNIVHSIALAANGKFIAVFVLSSISFLDASTLTHIGPVIGDSDGKLIRSIAISVDSSQLATGREDGKIVIRDLSKILPDSYGPFHVSRNLGMSNNPHPVSYGDTLYRHLLARTHGKTSMTIRHRTLTE